MKELVKPNKFEEKAQEVETFCEPNFACGCKGSAGSTFSSTDDEEEILF